MEFSQPINIHILSSQAKCPIRMDSSNAIESINIYTCIHVARIYIVIFKSIATECILLLFQYTDLPVGQVLIDLILLWSIRFTCFKGFLAK